jgi:prolyl-tRNA editing enzyme YbaK/EbsC (Cys-tRNA(Pro) deacylase)
LPPGDNGLPASARRVRDALAEGGFANRVVEMPDSTRSAADAAASVGCTVAQIAKSIVFRAAESDRPVLVIASGVNRVDEALVGAALGEPLAKADADFVRAGTGFAIGGVPPIGHSGPVEIFIDMDLLQHAEIWAAAGTPRCVFRLTPDDLVRMTGGRVMTTK